MSRKTRTTAERNALEKAAKYVCTVKLGLCPMVVENFACPHPCDLETLPWRCWLDYFKNLPQDRKSLGEKRKIFKP